jgi:site-specific DNA-cytosine methylase
MRQHQYAVASFFSGIGGIDLGFELTESYRIAFQCEIDPFCLTVLQKRWPSVTRAKDIREIKIEDVPPTEVWVGGFPCQDVSVATMGPRAGLRGKQSSLFFEYARLLREVRPRIFLIENVPGLLSSHGGETSKSLFERWPNSGMVWDGVCLTARTSESPNHVRESILLDVVETGQVPDRYFLSQNAARGILRRADRMGRRLFRPLRKSLEILSRARSSKE